MVIHDFFSGPHKPKITEHGIWSHNGHVVMNDISHLKLIATSLLQTCSYVTGQMQTPVTIDINKFMESFSIKADGGDIHLPSWTAGENNSVTLSPATAIISQPQSSSHSTSPTPFTMEDYRRCRQVEAINWINLQERLSSVRPRLQPVRAEEYQERRDAVNSASGPLRRNGIKFHFIHHLKYNIDYIFI